jgi:surface polysaccharide O-acyltransferase-like enzyme
MQGVHDHLWFLMGLLCSLAIASVLIRFNLQMLLIAAAVMLYGTALLGGPYSASPLGFHANFNFRNGPFFSLLFFVTGYLLQRRTSRMRWASIGLLLVFFGICLSIFELTIIKNYWGTTMCQDYVIGTYPFGLGIALIALSNFGHSKMRLPASVAPMVLGIYVSHYGFIMMLHPLDRLLAVKTTWEIFQTVLVFYLAFAATRLFSKYKITQKLVS